MPRYRLTTKSFINGRLYDEGEIVEYDGPVKPGSPSMVLIEEAEEDLGEDEPKQRRRRKE